MPSLNINNNNNINHTKTASLPSSLARPARPPRHTAPASFLNGKSYYHFYLQTLGLMWFIGAITASLISAQLAAAASVTSNLKTCFTGTVDSTTDLFPDQVNFTSPALTYEYAKTYKVITNSLAGEKVVLYQCGTPQPTVVNATRYISIPVQNVSISSSTMVTYFELLGLRTAIKYTTGGAAYITSPCVQALTNTTNAIQDVDSTNTTKALQQLNSVGVAFGAFDDLTSAANNSVSFSSSSDPGSLRRAAWLGFAAAFFNLEATSNAITANLVSNYQCLNSSARSLAKTTPSVAFVSYVAPSKYNNNTASWSISAAQYKRDFVSDAGGFFFVPKNGTSTVTFTSASDFLAAVANVDILIDETFGGKSNVEFNKNFNTTDSSAFKFIQNKQIWMTDKESTLNAADGWFEAAVVEANSVLTDFISVIQPSLLPSSYSPRWLRNIYQTADVTVLTGKNCSDPTASLSLPTTTCPLTAATTKSAAARFSVGQWAAAAAIVAAVAAML